MINFFDKDARSVVLDKGIKLIDHGVQLDGSRLKTLENSIAPKFLISITLQFESSHKQSEVHTQYFFLSKILKLRVNKGLKVKHLPKPVQSSQRQGDENLKS